MNSCIMPTYVRQPLIFVRGEGSYLYTKDGTAYLVDWQEKAATVLCQAVGMVQVFFCQFGC